MLLLCLFLLSHFNTAVANPPGQTAEPFADRFGADRFGADRFGIVEGYEAPEAASELGVGWSRVRFNWAEVQAGGPGTWTPAVSDEQINEEIARGRTVVGLLIGIPDWARGANRLPRGLWLAHNEPRNQWARFVRQAVERYDGRINHWIIWNEPDIDDPAAPGHTWDGSLEDFVQLQRVAHLVAKEANPDAVIHLAAVTHFWAPTYFGRLLDALAAAPGAAANHYYFDVVTAHLYFQPDSIYTILQSFASDLEARGLARPIWLVETNAPPINDPAWPVRNWTLSVTLDEQAAFIPQALAAALAAGAERIAVYKLKDTADDRAANPEPFGLLRQNGRRRPAFTTYQVAIRYLSGAATITRERWDEVGQIRLDEERFSTTVLFSRLPFPQEARVRATAASGVLIDMWGERRPVTAENNSFTVELPPALCTQSIGDYCMIGGTTYYLIQARGGEETADGRPLTTGEQGSRATPPPVATASAVLPTPSGPGVTPTREAAGNGNAQQEVAHTPPPSLVTAANSTGETSHEIDPVPPAGGPAAREGVLGYLFLGAAALLALGLGSWWRISGRQR